MFFTVSLFITYLLGQRFYYTAVFNTVYLFLMKVRTSCIFSYWSIHNMQVMICDLMEAKPSIGPSRRFRPKTQHERALRCSTHTAKRSSERLSCHRGLDHMKLIPTGWWSLHFPNLKTKKAEGNSSCLYWCLKKQRSLCKSCGCGRKQLMTKCSENICKIVQLFLSFGKGRSDQRYKEGLLSLYFIRLYGIPFRHQRAKCPS